MDGSAGQKSDRGEISTHASHLEQIQKGFDLVLGSFAETLRVIGGDLPPQQDRDTPACERPAPGGSLRRAETAACAIESQLAELSKMAAAFQKLA